jgi:hypothetical protein
MDTNRLILYTDSDGSLKGLPKFPPNKKVEAFFRISGPSEAPFCPRRLPHPEIAGKLQIKGDIFDTVAEAEWNLPR